MTSETRMRKIRNVRHLIKEYEDVLGNDNIEFEVKAWASAELKKLKRRLASLERDEIMDSMGLVKVRGCVSGRTYYE
jgi:hypothetical protein